MKKIQDVQIRNPLFDIEDKDYYLDDCELYEGTGELFELSSPSVSGNKGTTPSYVSYYRDTIGKIFTDRGSIKFDSTDENNIIYDIDLFNTMNFEFYMYPNFSYTDFNKTIFDLNVGNDINKINLSYVSPAEILVVNSTTINLDEATTDLSTIEAMITDDLPTDITISDDGTYLILTTTTTGSSTEISIDDTIGAKRLGFISGTYNGTDVTSGYQTFVDTTDPTASVAGDYTFTATVDGTAGAGDLTVTLADNDTLANIASYAATAINNDANISGASLSVTGSVDADGKVRITSNSTGASSTISLTEPSAGSSLLTLLGGVDTAVNGEDATAATTTSTIDMTSGYDWGTGGKYKLTFLQDSSNYLEIKTDNIIDDTTLQTKTFIHFTFDLTNNLYIFYINDTSITDSLFIGTGITGIDLTGLSNIIFGAKYDSSGKSEFSDYNINDLIIESEYNTDNSHFTSGKYYISSNRWMGNNTNFFLDDNGNLGVKGLFAENLFVGGSPIKSIHDVLDPIGTIKMFDAENAGGSSGGKSGVWEDNKTIPGWYACVSGNEEHGCLDLTDKFIMGKVTSGAGVNGGNNLHTISTSELPTHTHTINHDHPAKVSGTQSASHTHYVSGTTSSAGSHSHDIPRCLSDSGSGHYLTDRGGGSDNFQGSYTNSGGTHTHTWSDTSNNQSASHTHTTNLDNYTGNSGDGGFSNIAIDMKPAYYSVIYIRKCY